MYTCRIGEIRKFCPSVVYILSQFEREKRAGRFGMYVSTGNIENLVGISCPKIVHLGRQLR